jgi:hypothetical protein
MRADGFAVIDANGIHVKTVSPTVIGAMTNGLMTIMGVPVYDGISDDDIRELWRVGASAFSVELVPVTITYERAKAANE